MSGGLNLVYFLVGKGFEETELIAPVDILRRGGVEVQTVGIGGTEIEGAHGVTIRTDTTVEKIDDGKLEMIVLPGGMGGVTAIRGSAAAIRALRAAHTGGKFVAAICAGPTVLAELGITDGKKAVCYPGMESEMGAAEMIDADAVRDGKLICGRAPGAALDFGLLLLETLKGKDTAETVRRGLVYEKR